MENVTDQVSNPFGMRPPCPHRCIETEERSAVFGYGDVNADFHVIGDHPGVHGGDRTGIPFTGHRSGERILEVLQAVGFIEDRPTTDASVPIENCFLSYRYCCCVPEGRPPSRAEYEDFDRFFDAELRAIAADVLIPVGEPATRHVLAEYTARTGRIELAMDQLHATEIRGRGFLVVPTKDPSAWTDTDRDRLVTDLESILSMDYHQMVDLGRFLPGGDPYFVR